MQASVDYLKTLVDLPTKEQLLLSLWFLVGNGGRDPYDSPLRSLIVVPFPHSLLRPRESSMCRLLGVGIRV